MKMLLSLSRSIILVSAAMKMKQEHKTLTQLTVTL